MQLHLDRAASVLVSSAQIVRFCFVCAEPFLFCSFVLQGAHRIPQDRSEVRGPDGGRVRACRQQGAAHHPQLHMQHDRGNWPVIHSWNCKFPPLPVLYLGESNIGHGFLLRFNYHPCFTVDQTGVCAVSRSFAVNHLWKAEQLPMNCQGSYFIFL